MKLMADVIDLAINEYLLTRPSSKRIRRAQFFSCAAIAKANCNESTTEDIMNFLRSMGVNPTSPLEFISVPFGTKRQYARALWLTWAAMIAREEGKTI